MLSARRRGVITLTFFVVLLAFTTHTLFAQGDGTEPLEVTVSYTAISGEDLPVSVAGKDVSTVEIRVTARENICQDVVSARPIDVVLVIDVSGSMGDPTSDGTPKLDATKQAANAFVEQLSPTDRVAVVGFSDSAFTAIGLGNDFNAVRDAINGLSLAGGTNIASGINEASAILGGPDQAPMGTSIPVIIVLSDGQDNAASVTSAADRARDTLEQARIASIGLGNDVDQSLLTSIADPGLAFFTADSAQLLTIYQTLITLVQPRLSATNITIAYRYDRAAYELQPTTISPAPDIISGDIIQWTLASLTEGDSETFRFDVRSTSAGRASVGQVSVLYFPCAEPDTSTESFEDLCARGLCITSLQAGPDIDTILPSPTPIPSNTPIPTATSTPLPTATPLAPNALAQGPNGTIDNPQVTSAFCDDSTYNWLGIIIALVVLLLVLLFVFVFLRRRMNNGTKMTSRDWLCYSLRTAAVVYFALLLFAFLPPVMTNQFCEMPDSIYFRQMDTNASGIFLTHPDFDGDEMPQVSTLNETGCVGCHVSNDEANRLAAVIGPPPGRIVIIDQDGNRLDQSLVAGVYLSFSPDGRQLVYSDQNADLYILDIASGQTFSVPGASDPNIAELMPAWHPTDDSVIAFVRADLNDTHELGLYVDNRSDIYIVDFDTGQPATPVIGASGNALNYYPAFSPEGDYLLFTRSLSGRSYNNPDADLWLVPLDSGQAVRLSINDDGASDAWAVWSKDGQSIAFQSNRQDDNYDIFVADIVQDGNLLDARNATPLAGASTSGSYEYTAVFGEPITRISVIEEVTPLFPLLVPLAALVLLSLACLLIPQSAVVVDVDSESITPYRPAPLVSPPQDIIVKRQLQVLWDPQPTLVIGLGNAGRWVLTHLKKSLLDATLDNPPHDVVLMAIDSASSGQHATDGRTTSISFAGVRLGEDEVIEWRDSLRTMIQNIGRDQALQGWLNAEYIENIGMSNFDPTRGFSDYRILGRLALIQNLRGEYRETGVSVWERLKEAARRAKTNDDNLSVMLVADLSDDVGSGTFIDMAHLIRRLQRELDLAGVRIVGHFVTENAQSDLRANDRAFARRQVNTAAALRELQRFELSSTDRAMPIRYSSNEQPHPLDGTISRSLFDEMYLYDGGAATSNISRKKPQYGVYPAIADSIAVWIDKAAASGDLQERRTTQLASTRQQQRVETELMVSSIGIYQYRLPFNDILRAITAKYARTVLQWLLLAREGEPSLEFQETFDPLFRIGSGANSQPMTADEIARRFLAEDYGSPPETLHKHWRNLLQLCFSSYDERAIKRGATAFTKRFEAGIPILMDWLRQFVLVILNGSQYQDEAENQDYDYNYVELRGAKLALAKYVLEALCGDDGRDGILQAQANQLRSLTGQDDSLAALALEKWAADIYQLYQQLMETARWIGAYATDYSLYLQLGDWESQIHEAQSELTQLVAREHIWTNPNDARYKSFVEAWYQEYMHDNVLRGLAALHWDLNEANEIQLQMRMPVLEESDADPDLVVLQLNFKDAEKSRQQVAEFAARFVELARVFAANIPREQNLSNILAYDVLAQENLRKTAQQLKTNAVVALQYERGRTEIESLILSANINVDTQMLGGFLSESGEPLTVLQTTDPYTLTLIKTVDALKILRVSSINDAITVYQRETGILAAQDNFLLRPTEVFPIEHEALYFERKLRRVREPGRMFNPVAMALLINSVHVRTYLLALASNIDAKLGAEGEIQFTAPEWQGELVSHREARQLPSPIYEGLQAYIQKVPLETAQRIWVRYSGPDGEGSEDDNLLDRWEAFRDRQYQSWLTLNDERQSQLDKDVIRDLTSIARILADLQVR